jgi:transposase
VPGSYSNYQYPFALEDTEQAFHSGNPAYKDDTRYEYLISQMDYYQTQLKQTVVNRRLLWEEYNQSHPQGYSYSQFCWHLQQYERAKRPTAVLEHKAGEKLFVDFAGSTLTYTDLQNAQVISCRVFVACLPYSDFGFATRGSKSES